jgi:hypothetical protein
VRAFREEQILATILGYAENWAAWRAGEGGVSPLLDLSTTLREIAQRADDHYLARGADFLEQVRRKRQQIGYQR